jgi:tellurite resistance protein TerC
MQVLNLGAVVMMMMMKILANTAGAKLIKKFYKVSDNYEGDKFFTIQNGKKVATPLLVVVAVIEFTDVTYLLLIQFLQFLQFQKTHLYFILQIFLLFLDLRSLYFLLSNFIHMFSKLPYGLAIILDIYWCKNDNFSLVSYFFSNFIRLVGGVLVISVISINYVS